VSFRRRAAAPRLIEWTGERCVPWAPDVQVVYEHMHRYLWAAGLVAGRRVLDVGSGEGFGAAILVSEPAPSERRRRITLVLTIAEAAQRVGRSPGTVRRWIREGRLPADTAQGKRLIDAGALDEVRDEMYPMLPLPPEWERLEDGTPAPNWVAAVALSRLGR